MGTICGWLEESMEEREAFLCLKLFLFEFRILFLQIMKFLKTTVLKLGFVLSHQQAQLRMQKWQELGLCILACEVGGKKLLQFYFLKTTIKLTDCKNFGEIKPLELYKLLLPLGQTVCSVKEKDCVLHRALCSHPLPLTEMSNVRDQIPESQAWFTHLSVWQNCDSIYVSWHERCLQNDFAHTNHLLLAALL